MVRAQVLRARLTNLIANSDRGKDAIDEAVQPPPQRGTPPAVSAPRRAVPQNEGGSTARNSAMPIDVAMKLEVQVYFDPWLAAVENSVRFLKQARLTALSVGLLPVDAIDEIVGIVDLSDAMVEFSKGVSSLTGESVELRSDLISFYELLLWLTMYRPRLSRVPNVTDPSGRESKAVPFADKGTVNLLRYLALRFFGMGTIEGEGASAELVVSDDELLAVYVKTEDLCAKLFAPSPAQKDEGDSSLGTTLSQSLKTIRFVVLPYDTK